MGKPLIQDVIEKPATSLIICICTFVWAFIQKKNIGYSDVGFSYKSVVVEGQYWRGLTSAISHISFVHLVFNMSALWSLGIAEKCRNEFSGEEMNGGKSLPTEAKLSVDGFGTSLYLTYSLLLLLLSNLFVLVFYYVLIFRFRLEYYERVFGVGYSCVVFGWMTILSVKQPYFKFQFLGFFSLPIHFAPFESLILTAMIVPQSSFFGHLSGILAGYVIAWDWFQDVNGYWTCVLVMWLTIGFFLSLKRSSSRLPFLHMEAILDSEISAVQLDRSNGSYESEHVAEMNRNSSLTPDERV